MTLLGWAIVAFIIALITGAFGFTGVSRGAAVAARWLFGLFILIALILLILALLGLSLIA